MILLISFAVAPIWDELFFFNDTATTEIYTLSLHDALPICRAARWGWRWWAAWPSPSSSDRKSTRLNSSHLVISYAVFCLKTKIALRGYIASIKFVKNSYCTSDFTSEIIKDIRVRTYPTDRA